MPIDYTDEDLVARWEEFLEAEENRLKLLELTDRYPGLRSLTVTYSDIDRFDPDFASFILLHPDRSLEKGEGVVKRLMSPSKASIDIHLRIKDLPRDSRIEIRHLRSEHLGKLLSVEGLVRKATEVRPRLILGVFKCMRCPARIVEPQDGLFFREPMECYKEQEGCGRTAGSTKFVLQAEESIYVDTQKVEMQESPEGLRGGAQPERLTAYLEDDLAGIIAPGDRVVLNGVLRSRQKDKQIKSTLFDIDLDVLSMEFEQHEYEEVQISEEDEERIKKEASDPEVFRKIVGSIAPAIHGYDEVKEAIALQLFGGTAKHLEDGTKIRGDIHILLVGDPGVAKCVTGDARVLMGDSSEANIKELVDGWMSKGEVKEVDDGEYADADFEVMTFTHRGYLEKGRAMRVWRRDSPRRLLKFTTESGRTLTMTSTHPLFVQNAYFLAQRAASKIIEGNCIAVAIDEVPEGNHCGYNRGIGWDQVVKKEEVKAEERFVYDIEVDTTHIFVANGIISHNSQILRYMSEMAPRGIYASGKSSSAAGLCVAPDTLIEVNGKKQPIGEFVESRMKAPREIEPGVWRQEARINGALSVKDDRHTDVRPVSALFRLRTPSFLVELEVASGERIVVTPETMLRGMSEAESKWVRASDIRADDKLLMAPSGSGSGDVRASKVKGVKELHEDLPPHVYDLTVEGAHSFIGNGFLVHNTAAAVKDEFGDGRWTLEAGALVLADKGLAAIDELDKMTEQDRSSMHEAMESQRVSVAKAGITASLQCRCSMLGAANPKFGRFDDTEPLASQINMPPALLSRFDLIFALTDKPNAARDQKIAEHILKGHVRGELRNVPNPETIKGIDYNRIMEETDVLKPIFDREFMRKYVAHAKRYTPVLSDEARQLIIDKYLSIRKLGEKQGSSVPITARQLEAFIRLSEASARIRLSQIVAKEDADRAIKIVEHYLKKMASDEGTIDVDKLMTGTTRNERNRIALVRQLIHDNSDPRSGISELTLIQKASERNLSEVELKEVLRKLKQAGDIFEVQAGHYKLITSD
ncbi:MAG: ATP-binding protein [Methanomassiliicoccales archaeon]|nr:ATP-binding protein [Methanomassiliicoccales archaeon]